MKAWIIIARWIWLAIKLVLAVVREWRRVEREIPQVGQGRPAIRLKITERKQRVYDQAVARHIETATGIRPTAEQVAEVRAHVDDVLNPKSRWRRPNAGRPLGSKP